MTDATSVSLWLAFGAGLVSFLSPCVLPLVPSYVTFVTGMTMNELTTRGRGDARRRAAVHAALFILGFTLVFLTLGATATALGAALRRELPLVQQIGGAVIVMFGLYLLGVLRPGMLMRERRVYLASKPAGHAGSVIAGVAFGAGWTPCVGPVLASILLYAGTRATVAKGLLLLSAYSLGLGVPFFIAAVALNWYLAGARRLTRWLGVIETTSGALLVLVGVLLITGRFALVSGFLAGLGQLVHVEL
jgi:cytochrome c-type biogenesis protein